MFRAGYLLSKGQRSVIFPSVILFPTIIFLQRFSSCDHFSFVRFFIFLSFQFSMHLAFLALPSIRIAKSIKSSATRSYTTELSLPCTLLPRVARLLGADEGLFSHSELRLVPKRHNTSQNMLILRAYFTSHSCKQRNIETFPKTLAFILQSSRWFAARAQGSYATTLPERSFSVMRRDNSTRTRCASSVLFKLNRRVYMATDAEETGCESNVRRGRPKNVRDV